MNKIFIYPHSITVFGKLLTFLIFFAIPACAAIWLFSPEEYKFQGLLAVGVGTAIFLFYSALNYTHTYTEISEKGIIVREGWIPNKENTIFWIDIKDIDANSNTRESMFGSGTITMLVTIRTQEEKIKLKFIQNYRVPLELIRSEISARKNDARTMSYS